MRAFFVAGLLFLMFFAVSCGGSEKEEKYAVGSLCGQCNPDLSCDKDFVCDEQNNVCRADKDFSSVCVPECNKGVKETCVDLATGLIWSDKLAGERKWQYASDYCGYFEDKGYTDWRLPNIDELRTLVKDCDGTEPGGACKISEADSLLSSIDWSFDDCHTCSMDTRGNGRHSKLGDYESIWSSSSRSNGSEVWYLFFGNAGINFTDKDKEFNFRCVR